MHVHAYRHQPVALPQLATEVSWTPGQDEGDEDSFAVLTAYDVEAQPGGPAVQHHLPGLPAREDSS